MVPYCSKFIESGEIFHLGVLGVSKERGTEAPDDCLRIGILDCKGCHLHG